MKQRLYVAYGSNLNIEQMAYRCPTAKLLGVGVIKNYELQFKGHSLGSYATIAPKENESVPVGVWVIQPQDERRLDSYEGYPSHYFKKNIPVEMQDGKTVNAMVYIMNLRMQFGLPSAMYYKTVHQGYLDCGLDVKVLDEAVLKSTQKYYARYVAQMEEQTIMDFPDDETEESEDLEELEETTPIMGG